MTARVQIEIEAQDNASGVLRAIAGQFGALGGVVSDFGNLLSSSNKFVNMYNSGLKGAAVSADDLAKAQGVAQAASARFAEALVMLAVNTLKDSINATMEYAAQVRDLSLASGQSAEDTSRLIQVLDDYEITTNDITAATRRMTKNGLEPNIETIAQLADQYNALSTPLEKNQFLMENFGRAGAGWANALSQGGDKLRALNGAVSENLILTDKNIKEAEEYRLAVDNLSDAWEGVKIKIGSEVIPVLTNLMTNTNDAANMTRQQMMALAHLDAAFEQGRITQEEYDAGILKNNITVGKAAHASNALSKAQENAAEDTKKLNEEMTKQNEQLLTLSERLTGASGQQVANVAYEQFKAAMMSDGVLLDEERQKIESVGLALGQIDQAAITAATQMATWRDAVANGTMSEEEFIKKTEELKASYEARAEAARSAVTPLAELVSMAERLNKATEEQIKAQAYQDLKAKMQESGGIITDEEAKILGEAGVALGIFDEKALGAAKAIDTLNQNLISTGDLAAYAAGINDLAAAYQNLDSAASGAAEATSSTSTSGGDTGSGSYGGAYATGTSGWVTVPPGYPNDSYAVGLSSGESYAVNTAAQSGGDTVNNSNSSTTNIFYGNITMGTDGAGGISEIRI